MSCRLPKVRLALPLPLALAGAVMLAALPVSRATAQRDTVAIAVAVSQLARVSPPVVAPPRLTLPRHTAAIERGAIPSGASIPDPGASSRSPMLAISAKAPLPTSPTRRVATTVDIPGTEPPAPAPESRAGARQEARGGIERPHLATGAYYAFLGGAVAANAVGHFIDDPGGYPQQWDQWTVFHVVGGWSLDALGEKLAVPVAYRGVPVRPLAVCATVAAWEEAKGYADWRDMAAGCAGAMMSAGSTWLFRALF